MTFDSTPRSMSPCPPPQNAGPEKVQNPLKARRLRMQMRWYHDFHYNSVEQTADPSTVQKSFTAAAPATPMSVNTVHLCSFLHVVTGVYTTASASSSSSVLNNKRA